MHVYFPVKKCGLVGKIVEMDPRLVTNSVELNNDDEKHVPAVYNWWWRVGGGANRYWNYITRYYYYNELSRTRIARRREPTSKSRLPWYLIFFPFRVYLYTHCAVYTGVWSEREKSRADASTTWRRSRWWGRQDTQLTERERDKSIYLIATWRVHYVHEQFTAGHRHKESLQNHAIITLGFCYFTVNAAARDSNRHFYKVFVPLRDGEEVFLSQCVFDVEPLARERGTTGKMMVLLMWTISSVFFFFIFFFLTLVSCSQAFVTAPDASGTHFAWLKHLLSWFVFHLCDAQLFQVGFFHFMTLHWLIDFA